MNVHIADINEIMETIKQNNQVTNNSIIELTKNSIRKETLNNLMEESNN